MKPVAVDPSTTKRASAYALWMNAPNPMVTFFKTMDVTRLVRLSRRHGVKFNLLLCWCIGKAAAEVEEFYLLPVGRELMRYDALAVNTIVKNRTGEVSSCDVPFSSDLKQFSADYLRLSSVSLTYELPSDALRALRLERLAITLTGNNLYTFCNKKLKGQTPKQSGFAEVQLSDTPYYTIDFNIQF